ncbi:MAG: bifunctional adenosylcobinamide kinase/adenosylcobinamide-phosphate guanylyltransferase [Planctomycetes bacterium]|nr:bifunctional adenosylcobinamide kinase/adenosylcobinamide-phosphate guanylyltransferase [Planctomycetota bacterium]
MKKLILILGGARSGKSSYAVEMAKEFKKKVVFIATAACCDEEMAKRIALHKNSRPKQWDLIEEGKDIVSILPALKDKYEVVLIDCLGLLVSNLLADDLTDEEIERRIKKLVEAIQKINITTIMVSNEVGSGIVPMNALARRFRDLLGLSNQMIAKKSDEVVFMRAGIPVKIKG